MKVERLTLSYIVCLTSHYRLHGGGSDSEKSVGFGSSHSSKVSSSVGIQCFWKLFWLLAPTTFIGTAEECMLPCFSRLSNRRLIAHSSWRQQGGIATASCWPQHERIWSLHRVYIGWSDYVGLVCFYPLMAFVLSSTQLSSARLSSSQLHSAETILPG